MFRGKYESCVILHTRKDAYKAVIRCIYHDVKVCGFSKVAEALLIGSLGFHSLLFGRAYTLVLSTMVR